MKISTNSIGNYKPINNVIPKNIAKVADSKIQTEKTITDAEKKFFTKLYPNEQNTISEYHFYNKEGDKNGVSLGSIFDRRG